MSPLIGIGVGSAVGPFRTKVLLRLVVIATVRGRKDDFATLAVGRLIGGQSLVERKTVIVVLRSQTHASLAESTRTAGSVVGQRRMIATEGAPVNEKMEGLIWALSMLVAARLTGIVAKLCSLQMLEALLGRELESPCRCKRLTWILIMRRVRVVIRLIGGLLLFITLMLGLKTRSGRVYLIEIGLLLLCAGLWDNKYAVGGLERKADMTFRTREFLYPCSW